MEPGFKEGKPLAEFFLIIPPGLEDLAADELRQWRPDVLPQKEFGGLRLECPLERGLALNLCLKIPTRILLRVDSFRCRDFPKLFKKISHFPWEEWLDPGVQLEVHVASSKSRLNMKKRIQDTVQKGWLHFQKKTQAAVQDACVSLYVRFHEDLCTLSLDTSGERLHKRSGDKFIGKAPLRETLAAALFELVSAESVDKAVEIVDPMMGSGTLLSEAFLKSHVFSQRHFAFEHFKFSSLESPKYHGPKREILQMVGYEKDPKTFSVASRNLKKLSSEISFELFQQDFFEASPLLRTPSSLPPRERWVLCNPPYGERLKIKGSPQKFYESLFAQMEKILMPDRVCLLLPERPLKGKLNLPPSWKVKAKIKTSNGGIAVNMFLFHRV